MPSAPASSPTRRATPVYGLTIFACIRSQTIAAQSARIIEHKHFDDQGSTHTWITKEYPQPYHAGIDEPYYPMNDHENNAAFARYQTRANDLANYHFGGRLANYRYYDMHQVIEKALAFTDSIDPASHDPI